MMEMKVEHVVARIADLIVSQRPTKGRPELTVNGQEPVPYFNSLKNGLYGTLFQIQFDAENYGYSKRDSNKSNPEWKRRYIQIVNIIVTQKHNVFYALSTDSREIPPVSEWVNSSNHDACWHTDGLRILTEVYFEAYEQCYGFMPDEDRPAPAMTFPFVQFNNWHFGHHPFKMVKVRGEYNHEDDYRWSLTEIRPVEWSMNIIDPEAQEGAGAE